MTATAIVASGGICAPMTSYYDLLGQYTREPWRFADDPFPQYEHNWDLLVAPRLTEWQRRWNVRRRNLRAARKVLRHGLPPERDYDW